MIGNPIFGTGYVHQSSRRPRSSATRSPSSVPASAAAAKPGLLSPKGEKRLWSALKDRDAAAARQVGSDLEGYRTAAYCIAGLLLAESEPAEAERLLALVLESDQEPTADPFVRKYVSGSLLRLQIAPGVEAELPIGRDAVGLLVAELRQGAGNLDGAVEAVERLEPTPYAAVSLVELYSQLGRHADVIDVTDGVDNEDDATALLLAYRGIALREIDYLDASLEAFKAAVRARSRNSAIRNLAYSERAKTYLAQGRRAMARKDLERVLGADSTFDDVRERLRALE